MNAPQTNETGGVLATIDRAIARNLERGATKGSPSDKELREARAAVARAIAERDALREVLREFQDGRRYSNPQTRQVARDIERTALARVGGA